MNKRKLTDSVSCRLWEDNFDYIQKVCDATGRPYREVLRDLVDEAIRSRLNPSPDPGADGVARSLELLIEQNRLTNERYEELVKRYEQLAEREAKLKQGLMAQLRDFAGILGEALAAAIGARRLTWNYLAYEALKGFKYSDSQIKERLDAENKAWMAERDETIREVRRIIRSKWPSSD